LTEFSIGNNDNGLIIMNNGYNLTHNIIKPHNFQNEMLSNNHFFLSFFFFLIFILAGGMGIRKPSSAGSVILTMFLIMFIPFVDSLTSFNFYSLILGVKLIIKVLIYDNVLTWSRKWSERRYRLLSSTKFKPGQRFNNW